MFNGCTALKSITIPASVTTLGKGSDGSVFQNSGLTSITFLGEGKIESFGSNIFSNIDFTDTPGAAQNILNAVTKALKRTEGEFVLPARIFMNSVGVGAIVIPADYTSIGERAFDCDGITSVTFAEGSKVTSFGGSAFTKLGALTSFQVPKGVKELTSSALGGFTDKLTSFTFEGGSELTKFDIALKGTNITELKLPKTVTFIGSNFLAECTKFEHLYIVDWKDSQWTTVGTDTLPDNVTSVGTNTFQKTKLTSFTIPATTQFGTGSNKSLPNYMFAECGDLTSVTINSTTVTQIGNYAFQKCVKLASITIPGTVTAINQYAFEGCKLLKTVTIQGTKVSSIGNYTFQNCSALDTINFPTSLTSIGMNAFMGCTSLTKVVLESVTTMSISGSAFSGCTNLAYFEAPANTNYSNTDIFKGCENLTTVKLHKGNNAYVSKSGTTAYTTSTYAYTPWYQMYQNAKAGQTVSLVIGTGITTFVNYAFYMTGTTAAASARFQIYFEDAESAITSKGSNNTLITDTNVTKHYVKGSTWEYDADGITPKKKEA